MPAIARVFPILVVALVLAGPLAAEDRSARFLRLMGKLPEAVLANLSPATPRFLDHVAAAEISVLAAASVPDLKPGAVRLLSGPLADAPPGLDWRPTVGFARDEVLAAADNGLLRGGAMVLLLDSAALPAIDPALTANGYARSDDRGFAALWRGADDGSVDLSRRAPDDPFAHSIPMSSRIALDGNLLLQSSTWPGLEAMMATTGPAPVLTAMAGALDLPDWGERKLVQATLFADAAVFSSGIRLSEDLTPSLAPPGGVPYWSNLMLADLSDGVTDLTLVVLVYAAKSDAEKATAVMAAGMVGIALPSRGDGVTLGDLIGTGSAQVSGDGPFTAIYAVETPPAVMSPTMMQNRGFTVLTMAALARELPLLGPVLP